MAEYGDHPLELVDSVLSGGVDHGVLLMRHSAREYEPGRHDLLNPLTDEGRALCTRLGRLLPKEVTLRAYSSPAERCVETADLILSSHEEEGGAVSRNRPLEGLGVFYMLDQMKAFLAMREAGGMTPFLARWFDGSLPVDIMLPPQEAAVAVARLCLEKLRSPVHHRQLDVLVSHDMTVYTLRSLLLNQREEFGEIEYLDGLLFFEREGVAYVQSHHSEAAVFSP